jgi:hypothetical protein
MQLPTMGYYLGLLRSQAVVIVLATVAGTALGFVAASRVPAAYQASRAVELPDVPTYVDLLPADPAPDRVTIDTTAQLVESEPVVRRTVQATGLTFRQVQNGLSVSAYPLSRVIIVSFTAPSTLLARRGAHAAAKALVVQRETALPGNQLDQASVVANRLSAILAQLDQLLPFSDTAVGWHEQLAHLTDITSAGTAGGRAIGKTVPQSVDQHPEVQILTGMVLGMFAGFIYAWWQPVVRRRQEPGGRATAVAVAR